VRSADRCHLRDKIGGYIREITGIADRLFPMQMRRQRIVKIPLPEGQNCVPFEV
jgi:hypothetical protein